MSLNPSNVVFFLVDKLSTFQICILEPVLVNVFGVWVECVKALLVNVCSGTAKSAEIESRDMSDTYLGAYSCRALYVCIRILNCTRYLTGSQ